jgi:MFS superfamily sulfate permease-like transporter
MVATLAWRDRLRFDRNELAGAFGDIGTDLPLILAMVGPTGFSLSSVLVLFGLAQIASGVAYGLPMPMQPLKAMAVIVITQQLAGDMLLMGGLVMGVVMLALSLSGALGWLARNIPRPVVRGIQLGLALSLANLALKKYVPADGAWGFGLAAVGLVIGLGLLGNRKVPAALVLMALGGAYALTQGLDWTAISGGVGLYLPTFAVPDFSLAGAAAWLLVAPQLPLSVSNSVVATEQTLKDLFPERQPPVTAKRIGLTYAASNLILPFFGGIPLCHGCGGLAGHYAMGGRTGGSVVIYGGLFLVVGLVFGGAAAEVLRLFPLPILGVVLLLEALSLGLLARDVAGDRTTFGITLLVALLAAGVPQGYLVGAVVGTLWWLWLRHRGALPSA